MLSVAESAATGGKFAVLAEKSGELGTTVLAVGVPALHREMAIAHSSVIDLQRGTMAKQLEIQGRRFWILSEPLETGWQASVMEMTGDDQEAVGIEATGETRGAADDAAERKLRRLLQA